MKLSILVLAFIVMSTTFGLMVEAENKTGIAFSLVAIFIVIALVINECYWGMLIRKAKGHEKS